MRTRIAGAALVAIALAVGMAGTANASLLKASTPAVGYDSDGTFDGLLIANQVCAGQAEVNVPVDEDTVVNICDLDDSECADPQPGCDTTPELITAEFGTAPPVPVPLWPTGFGSDGALQGPGDAGDMLCQQTDPQRVDVSEDVWVEICGS